MKFCSNCDTRLVQSYEDVGGPWVCPKCKCRFNEKEFKNHHEMKGTWKATAESKNKGRVVGFHINSFYG